MYKREIEKKQKNFYINLHKQAYSKKALTSSMFIHLLKYKQFQLTLVPKSEVISRYGGDEKTMTMQNRKKDNAKKEKDTSLDPNKSY